MSQGFHPQLMWPPPETPEKAANLGRTLFPPAQGSHSHPAYNTCVE